MKKSHIEANQIYLELVQQHEEAVLELQNLAHDIRQGATAYLALQHKQRLEQLGTTVSEYRARKKSGENQGKEEQFEQPKMSSAANDNIPGVANPGIESESLAA